MNEIRVGIVGIGNMGSAHTTCIAENNVEGLRLTAVCDIIESRVQNVRDKYPFVKTYTDYIEMFGNHMGLHQALHSS